MDLQVEEVLDENIYTTHGNVYHYYVDVDGQCNEIEDETIEGPNNTRVFENLDDV